MTASLGDIEDALFRALARINPAAAQGTPGTPLGTARKINGATVRYIGRWVGEPIRSTPVPDFYRAAVEKEVSDRAPGILLGFDGESVDPRPNAVETMAGNVETVGLATWSVLSVVKDSRTTRVVMQGTAPGASPTLGVYDVERLVEEALTNLGIAGLYRSTNVRFMDSRPLLISPGELYVLQTRFQTRRVLADARVTGTDAPYALLSKNPLLTLAANINVYPVGLEGDFPVLPYTPLRVYPGGAAPLPDRPPLRGLLARFDASAVNGVDRDGRPNLQPADRQPVAEWVDRHSGRWTLAQPDPTLQPTLDLTGIGAQPGVKFTDLKVLLGSMDWLPAGDEGRTLAVIGTDFASTGAANQAIAGYGQAVPSTASEFDLSLNVGATAGFALNAGGADTLQTASLPTAAPWLILARYDGTTATVRAIPVALVGSSASIPVALTTTNARGFQLGGRLIGTLCEVLVYRQSIDAGEESELIAYALARYGIAGS